MLGISDEMRRFATPDATLCNALQRFATPSCGGATQLNDLQDFDATLCNGMQRYATVSAKTAPARGEWTVESGQWEADETRRNPTVHPTESNEI